MPTASKKNPPAKRNGLVVSNYLDDRALNVALEVMRAGGHATIGGAMRTALWNYARHLGIDVPIDVLKA